MSNNSNETIRAGRRRKTEQPASQRPRAEMPRRRPNAGTSGGGASGAGSSSGGSGGGGSSGPTSSIGGLLSNLPSSGRMPKGGIGMILVIAVVACCFLGVLYMISPDTVGQLFSMLGSSSGQVAENPVFPTEDTSFTGDVSGEAEATEVPPPTRTPAPPKPTKTPGTSAGAAATKGETWTVLMYEDADDKILEQDIYLDLNEAERVGSTDQVKIVAQVDRFSGAYAGDGNWTSTRRFLITQDDDLERVNSDVLDEQGEVNMADANALVDFVTWAVEQYPADRYALILSDHGMGWPGGWSDPAPGGSAPRNIPLASRLGDHLFLNELEEALGEIRSQTGIEKFDLIGFDACLMGQLEVLTALEPHARYAVTSEEVEPALGWAYTGFLEKLANNPGMDGGELASTIVNSYIVDDQRIVDDEARAAFASQGSGGMFGMFSPPSRDQLARQLGETVTLSAVDLEQLPALQQEMNNLAFELQKADQSLVAKARTYAQSYTSIFGTSVPASYIDLASFLRIIKQEGSTAGVEAGIDSTLSALKQSVIAEKHGNKKPGSSGISIYFPNSQLYGNAMAGPESYSALASRFAEESLWDDFLAYHYTSQRFAAEPAAPVTSRAGNVRGPGAGVISAQPLKLSSTSAAPGKPVLMSTEISGENIGYIYLFVGYYDAESNSIFLADMDYLESAETRQENGVYYPVWGQSGSFTLEFEWEPVVFALGDGQDALVALFRPRSYGVSWEEAVYTVDGIYTFANGTGSLNARLSFSDGNLTHVYGITGEGETGAPREITPQVGDTFTVLETWLDLGTNGKVTGTQQIEGDTLTFGEEVLTWSEMSAGAGNYIIGFIIEDLDGQSVQVYGQVEVK